MALSVGQKAGWGLADLGIVIFVIVKQLLVLAYLTNYLGVPPAVAGLVTTAVLIFDFITDPIIGYLSDRTHSRWGRRVPWMVIGALVLAGGIFGMFSVPEGLTGTAALPWVIGFFVLATIGFTMVSIPYGAMAGEMTQDGKERSAMTAWRMGFASVGILVGGGVMPGIAGAQGYQMAALVVLPLIIGSIWLSVYATRRAPKLELPSSVSPVRMMRLVVSNRSFVVLALLYGVMTLAIALITAGLPFAAIYLITDDGSSPLSGFADALGILALLFAAFTVGSILSQAAWVWVSARLGKTGALVFGLFLYIGLLYWLFTALPSVNLTAIAGLFVLAGMTNGSYQQIPWAMYPDLMDVTRDETGEAIEGAFSAIWLFGQKVANALGPGAIGLILGAWGWVEAVDGERVEQSALALEALRWSMTLVPAAILAVSILGLWFLYRPRARQVVARV